MVRILEDERNDKLDKTGKPEQNFSNFFNAYARSFNQKYGRTGKLFQERFKRKKIEDDFYFTEIIYYIHANPQKHKLLDDFRNYDYSSYHIMLSSLETALKRDEVLEWFGGKNFFVKYHAEKQTLLTELNSFELRNSQHLAGLKNLRGMLEPPRCVI